MVACTPTYDLPYQEGTDRPCDLAPVWCQFAGVVETKLTEFDAILGRTATTVPFAKVRKTVAGAGVDHNPIQFDTVSADNDGMVDLTAEPEIIRIRRPGFWIGNYVITATAFSNDQQLVGGSIDGSSGDSSTYVRRYRVDGTSLFGIDVVTLQGEARFAITQASIDAAGGVPISLSLLISGTSTEPVVVTAELTVYWHCEL